MKRIFAIMLASILFAVPAMAYVECQPPVECTEEWSYADAQPAPSVKSSPKKIFTPAKPERVFEPVRPTPSIMVRGNQRVTVKTMDSVPIPDYSYTPEPEEKKSKLVGPSMGYSGGRKIRTYYAGSHQSSWKFAPNQTRYE